MGAIGASICLVLLTVWHGLEHANVKLVSPFLTCMVYIDMGPVMVCCRRLFDSCALQDFLAALLSLKLS